MIRDKLIFPTACQCSHCCHVSVSVLVVMFVNIFIYRLSTVFFVSHRDMFDYSKYMFDYTYNSTIGSIVVKALCYKPEGRWFDTR
jgi:hypothetical protein